MKSVLLHLVRATCWQSVSVITALSIAEFLVLPPLDRVWLWNPHELRDVTTSADLIVYLGTYALLTLVLNIIVIALVSYRVERISREAAVIAVIPTVFVSFFIFENLKRKVMYLLPVELGWEAISVYVVVALFIAAMVAPRPHQPSHAAEG